jgi:glycosyltransferase involved in cell wall biosynthesis
LLGTLTAEETAELYKKCELGVIFSTTNPSRIAFEMVACGTPAIEADCEYTKYDMDSDAFVRLNTEFDVIMNKIDELFADSNEMKRLQTECEIYSKNNFYKNAEEKLFYEFVEEGITKKKTYQTG